MRYDFNSPWFSAKPPRSLPFFKYWPFSLWPQPNATAHQPPPTPTNGRLTEKLAPWLFGQRKHIILAVTCGSWLNYDREYLGAWRPTHKHSCCLFLDKSNDTRKNELLDPAALVGKGKQMVCFGTSKSHQFEGLKTWNLFECRSDWGASEEYGSIVLAVVCFTKKE